MPAPGISLESFIAAVVALNTLIGAILFFLMKQVLSHQEKLKDAIGAITTRQAVIEHDLEHVTSDLKEMNGELKKLEVRVEDIGKLVHRKSSDIQAAVSRRDLDDDTRADPAGSH